MYVYYKILWKSHKVLSREQDYESSLKIIQYLLNTFLCALVNTSSQEFFWELLYLIMSVANIKIALKD